MSPKDKSPIEEHDNNLPSGFEFDPEESASLTRPYDPKLIRVDPKVYSLKQILELIEQKELDLAPDFQRLRVWKTKQKSLLIESILLRIPLPAFYFSSDEGGLLQVVDGVQRLSTIQEFVEDGFELRELEYLSDEVGGATYSDLKGSSWARRLEGTQIFANVIDPQTPVEVKFDIFRRINTGGTPLNSQEIRHCMSKKRSRRFLKDLCHREAFAQAVGAKLVDHVRMADRELALRFCAFRLQRSPTSGSYNTKYAYMQSLDEFLTTATQALDDRNEIPDVGLEDLKGDFDQSMRNARILFKEHAFRKWPDWTEQLYPLNRALFDAWSVTLADFSEDMVRARKEEIVEAARNMMTNDLIFIQSISTGTSDPTRIAVRFERVGRLMSKFS